MCVFIPDTEGDLSQSIPIVLYLYPEGVAPVEGKPQAVTVQAAEGYRYQWYVDTEKRGTAMALELKAAEYSPGVHRLVLIFRENGRGGFSLARHLTFTVVSS
jgi:hypothetical protein